MPLWSRTLGQPLTRKGALSLPYINPFMASTASGTMILSATSKCPCADSLEVPQHGLVVALAGGLPRLGYFADRLVLLRLSLSFLLHGGPQPSELLGKNRSVLTTSTVRARSRLEASCCFFGEINDARHQSN